MNRILMAAARGARIGMWNYTAQEWQLTTTFFTDPHDHVHFAIYPGDEHLAYGPVSTALREMAEQDIAIDCCLPARSVCGWSCRSPTSYLAYLTVYFDWHNAEGYTYMECKPLHRSLFLLILSEALCDAGL